VLTANPPLIIASAIAVAIMVRMDHSFGAVRFQKRFVDLAGTWMVRFGPICSIGQQAETTHRH
jgi:hypothetical protein